MYKRQAPCNFNGKLLKLLGNANLIDCNLLSLQCQFGKVYPPTRQSPNSWAFSLAVFLPHKDLLQMVSLHLQIQLWSCGTRFVTVFEPGTVQDGQCRWQLQFRNRCRRSHAVTTTAAALLPLYSYWVNLMCILLSSSNNWENTFSGKKKKEKKCT